VSRPEPVIIGNATLYLGDCLEILPTLPKVDAVITDPPYGIPHKFGKQKTWSGSGCKSGFRTLQFSWDGSDITSAVLSACALSAPLADAHIWFCGLHQVSYIADILLDHGMKPKPGAWVKKCPPPAGFGNWWPSGFEHIVYAYRQGAWFGDTDTKRSNVWISDSYRNGQPGKVDHPTQKPLSLVGRLLSAVVRSDATALDPFMGSGTTGVAAMQLGRQFIGVEKEPKYFDIACRRIEEAQQQADMCVAPVQAPTPQQTTIEDMQAA